MTVRRDTQPHNGTIKEAIYYHRSYRKLPVPGRRHFIQFLSLVVIVEVLLSLFFSDLNHLVNRCAMKILVHSMPFAKVELIWTEFLWRPITILNVPRSYPERWFLWANLIATMAVIIFIPRTKIPKPIVVALTLVSLIHLVSVLFFLIIADRFPYQAIDFSTTFEVMVIVTWFLIPIVFFLILYPLPSSPFSKVFVLLFALAFSMAFNILRFVIVLYLIFVYSFVFMAILFFCFGILLDTIFIVSFYSFYLSVISNKFRHDTRVWQWLY